AIQNLARTNIAHLELKKNHVQIKTMKEITNYFHWQWPIKDDLAGFIKAQMLPNIEE
ncbi:14722_t:CDS:1, partial [Cetraspora pellucida]